MPVTDGMAEAMLARAPQLTSTDAGLQAGQASNPFLQVGQLMKGAMARVDGAEELRLSEVLIGLEHDLVPADESLAKLAGFGRRAVAKDGKLLEHRAQLQRATAKLQEGTMLLMADAIDGAGGDADGPLSGVRNHVAGIVVTNPKSPNLGAQVGNAVFQNKSTFPMGMDVNAFVQAVLREAYMLDGELLMDEARKLDALNKWKRQALKKKRRAEELRLRLEGELSESERDEVMAELGRLLGFVPDETPAPVEELETSGSGQTTGAPSDAVDAGATAGPTETDGLPTGDDRESGPQLEDNGLTAAANEFLRSIEPVHIRPPVSSVDELRGLIRSSAWATSDAILDWFVSKDPNDDDETIAGMKRAFDAIIAGASELAPEDYARLFDGLVTALIRSRGADGRGKDNHPSNGYDDPYHDKCNDQGAKCHLFLHTSLRRLLAEGTPAQHDAIGRLSANEATLLGRLDGLEFNGQAFSLREFIDRSASLDQKNRLTSGTDSERLMDLYLKTQSRGFADGREEFLYALSRSAPQSAAAFLKELSSGMLTGPNAPTLEELFGALPPGHLEGENLQHFAFLNTLDFDAAGPSVFERVIEARASGAGGDVELARERLEAEGRRAPGGPAASPLFQSAKNMQAKLQLDDDAPTRGDAAPPEAPASGDAMNPSTGSMSELSEDELFQASLAIDFNDGGDPYVLKYNQMDEEALDEFLDSRLGQIDDAIETRGFDMSALQLEIQNLQQKRQQMLTMMSNLSKMLHDTIMSIIRNMGS